MSDVLGSALADGVLTLTLQRPEKKNALNAAMIDALRDALAHADADPDVRVIALRGAGDDFCAGADLGELLASADRAPAENERDALRLGEVFIALREHARPTVALVRGRALAGGAGLATACDLVLAAESATFGYPEMQRGFVPAMVMTMLRRLTGEKLALDLVLTGRLLGAASARDAGLVSRVAADDAFEAEAAALLAQLAGQSATAAHLGKRLFRELDGLSFRDGIALGARVNALARSTDDFRERIAAFLRK